MLIDWYLYEHLTVGPEYLTLPDFSFLSFYD